MTHQEAKAFIEDGITRGPYTWADLGAGAGTFTRALSELLGPQGAVYAVDERPVVDELEKRHPSKERAKIISLQADFTNPLDLPPLDGILMANALHYVADPIPLLERLVSHLRPGGTFLLIEYDRERGNPWVPHPVSRRKFRKLAKGVGLENLEEIYQRPSRYGNGELYAMKSHRAREQ